MKKKIDYSRWDGGTCDACWFCYFEGAVSGSCDLKCSALLPKSVMWSRVIVSRIWQGCSMFMPADYILELAKGGNRK